MKVSQADLFIYIYNVKVLGIGKKAITIIKEEYRFDHQWFSE